MVRDKETPALGYLHGWNPHAYAYGIPHLPTESRHDRGGCGQSVVPAFLPGGRVHANGNEYRRQKMDVGS